VSRKTPETDDTIVAEPAALVVRSVVPSPPDSLTALSTRDAKELVAGRYEILGLLGVGGMGAVYRVRDVRLDELVALKMLRVELVAAPQMRRRFEDEVKLARRVTHRNVARTFDIGDHDGAPFLTMELLHGESLGARLEREPTLALNHAIDVAIDVAHGLGAAHAAGVVHRDLKPDNVFLASDGRAVVTDFGIARAHASEGGGTGAIIGTPAYMAPEQIEGREDLDGRTDLYALGEVLYEMLTGACAWPEPNAMAQLAARLTKPPPDPRDASPDVPDAIAAIIAKLLARDRDERFAMAGDVIAALDRARSNARPSKKPVEAQLVPRALAPKGEKTVAVLPFRSHGAPDWVAPGLLEDLIDSLSMTRGLRVRPIGVVEPYRDAARAARDIGRELGVSVVVEGSIRAAGDDLRFGTRAIGVEDGFQIWAHKWQRPARGILDVSSEAARAIAGALTGDLELPDRGAQDPLAAEMYLRARAEYRASMHVKDHMVKVVGLFDAAVTLAPKDPHVLAGAALAHARLAFFSAAEQRTAERTRAQDLADRAIAIAPHLGDAWVAIATLRNYDGDYVGAGRALAAALRLSPNHAKAREVMGRILLEIGDLDDGIESLSGALDLDPSTYDPRWDLARGLALRGEIERAREVLARPCEGTSLVQRAWVRARLSMWYPDARQREIILAEPTPTEGAIASAVDALKVFIRDGTIGEKERAYFDAIGGFESQRVRLVARQVQTELYSAVGDGTEIILGLVRRLVDDGLLDVAWMDRCPLLRVARTNAAWAPLRQTVADRAASVRGAIRA
jgi:serine/threonine-protein kinase